MMLNKKKWTGIFIAGIFIAVIFVVFSGYQSGILASSGLGNRRPYVAVIAKSKDSAFWSSVFSGVNAAATEYNLTVTFEGPENEEDYETQNQLIDQAVENRAEVIVFSAVDYNANAEAIDRAAKQGVKIVVIDSDVNSEQVSCRISTNNYEAGRMAGEYVIANDDVYYVGIVNFDKNTANGQQREAGFRDVAETREEITIIDSVNVRSSIQDAKEATMIMLRQHPQIDVLVTFNEWTSLGVGYAIQELGLEDKIEVIAFDSHVVSVGMLETGEVDALVVQNPYAMGYLGVECAYELINGFPVDHEQVDTSTILVTKENMYDTECQRLLFSFDE